MDNNTAQPRTLLVFRHAPYGSALAREGLEAALAFGAMGAKTSVLYINEGVWQLLKAQKAERIDCKNQTAMAAALPLYDVEEIWIDQSSLSQRGIGSGDITGSGQIIDTEKVAELLATHPTLLSF